jgi:hypothetical protein
VRNQEIDRLKALARKLDIDYQEFDFRAFGYQEIKEQMLKRACVRTPEMMEKELVIWDNVAEQYDMTPIEQKVYVPEDMVNQEANFVNMLVLSFNVHDYSLAKKILLVKYKGNMMAQTQKILEANKKSTWKLRMMWFMGPKEVTNTILEDLREKHLLRPRVLRDSYFRRDFIHYADGKLYFMRKSDFKALMQKQSVVLAEEEQKLMEKMLH